MSEIQPMNCLGGGNPHTLCDCPRCRAAFAHLRDEVAKSAGDPNPVIKVTPLRAYPGWRVREYANGMFDATDDVGLSPGFDSFAATVAHVRSETVPTTPWQAGFDGGRCPDYEGGW